MRLRSNALAGQAPPPAGGELDYPSLINKALPDTIRVLGWADVAPEFSARCTQDLRMRLSALEKHVTAHHMSINSAAEDMSVQCVLWCQARLLAGKLTHGMCSLRSSALQ